MMHTMQYNNANEREEEKAPNGNHIITLTHSLKEQSNKPVPCKCLYIYYKIVQIVQIKSK